MKELYPSFANPETWRMNITEKVTKGEWKKLGLKILERDDYARQYCGFRSEKWQIVHHIDGDPNNSNENNLVTICPMCNLIHHAGQGCVVQGIVDLYRESKFSQNNIVKITREMRARGKSDEEIIKHLGLKEKVPFKMDKEHLKQLFGFITSRKSYQDWMRKALEYGYSETLHKHVW